MKRKYLFIKLAILVVMLLGYISLTRKCYANEQAMQFNWNLIPKNVQNILIGRNTEIRCSDVATYQLQALIDGGNPYMSAYSVQRRNKDVVYRNFIHVADGFETYLIHEAGHILSTYNNDLYFWAKTPQFVAIWQSEKGIFANDYYDEDIIEYFAEAFRWYCLIPDTLREKAPNTYNYINLVCEVAR